MTSSLVIKTVFSINILAQTSGKQKPPKQFFGGL